MERTLSHRPQILVVDDDPAIRRLIRDTLDGDGYAVATVATGKAVLAWLAVTRPDAVVLDVTMPRPDGWDILRRLRGTDWPGDHIPVVACLDRTIDRAKAFRYGADHYVLKPFAPDELRRRVEAIVPRPAALATDDRGASAAAGRRGDARRRAADALRGISGRSRGATPGAVASGRGAAGDRRRPADERGMWGWRAILLYAGVRCCQTVTVDRGALHDRSARRGTPVRATREGVLPAPHPRSRDGGEQAFCADRRPCPVIGGVTRSARPSGRARPAAPTARRSRSSRAPPGRPGTP